MTSLLFGEAHSLPLLREIELVHNVLPCDFLSLPGVRFLDVQVVPCVRVAWGRVVVTGVEFGPNVRTFDVADVNLFRSVVRVEEFVCRFEEGRVVELVVHEDALLHKLFVRSTVREF